jgi:hypothetical protein
MTYLFAFPAWSVASGFAFGGRPLPGTLRTRSSVSSGYKASLDIGSMPALTILCLAAKYDMPKASAISCIVKPVILLLSALYPKNINCLNGDTNNLTSVEENEKNNQKNLNLRYIFVDNNVKMAIHYI